MKVFGKSFKDYVNATRKFLLTVLALSVIQLLLLLLNLLDLMPVDPFGLLKMVLIIIAGWVVVRKHKFKLKHAVMVGLLLFIAGSCYTIPALFILIPEASLIYKLISFSISIPLNSIIYITFAVFGAWLAKIFKK